MNQFVCVRLVQGNGLDLSLFQFDYDLTFAVFFLHPDGTILGRYGTRSSHDDAERDISLAGFRKGMEKSLELFRDYRLHASALAAKRGGPPAAKVPEELPSLRGKYGSQLDYGGKLVQSCIHCHQIWDEPIARARQQKRSISDETLYPYPNPSVLGLHLDPQERTTVAAIDAGSAADKAGFQPGDSLESLQGQPLVSIADVQWILHHAGPTYTLRARVDRDGRSLELSLPLPIGWRRGDISWRSSTWELRRMGTGGLLLHDLDDEQRRKLNLDADRLALLVKHVGQYGAHALAKKEGFLNNDIVIAVDGKRDRMSESQLLDYMLRQKQVGEKAAAVVIRNGREMQLKIPTQ